MRKTNKKVYDKAYRIANRDKQSVQKKAYYKVNRDKKCAYQRTYREANKDKINTWYETNKKKVLAYRKIYCKANKDKRHTYERRKLRADPKYKLRRNISRSISDALRGNKDGWHWEDLVGYTLEKLKKHLERQFVNGMNWNNYGKGGWEIDHEIPISVFNFTQPEHRDFKRCWALSNLQPMWAKENNSKGAKLTKPFQPSLLI